MTMNQSARQAKRLVLAMLLLLLSARSLPAQNVPMMNGKAWSIEQVDWCITRATSKLREPNHGACKRAAAKHGWNKSQNEMGQSAVVELCRGNDQQAEEYIRACQCHNPGIMPNVLVTWPQLREWANQHPLCMNDREAHACSAGGGTWSNGKCIRDAALTQISSSCIQKNKLGVVGTQVTVEVANGCGQCVILQNWAYTLDGKTAFLNFDPKRLEVGGATNVVMNTNKPGVHDVTIWTVTTCD
ncbi:MAG: hypothetical protein EOS21_32425 [Mesorhizobium sp.]|nr:MAG: hypothetical protein EOS21_32425 [Mesorhizobium sp.]